MQHRNTWCQISQIPTLSKSYVRYTASYICYNKKRENYRFAKYWVDCYMHVILLSSYLCYCMIKHSKESLLTNVMSRMLVEGPSVMFTGAVWGSASFLRRLAILSIHVVLPTILSNSIAVSKINTARWKQRLTCQQRAWDSWTLSTKPVVPRVCAWIQQEYLSVLSTTIV